MNLELQTLVERLETLERQARGWKLMGVLSILLASAAITAPMWMPARFTRPAAPQTPTYSTVTANRFLLRDLDGKLAGGMEVTGNGTLRLVLGRGEGATASAFLEAQPNGIAHLTLRGADGGVRATLLGTRTPSLALASEGHATGATVMALDDGSGSVRIMDGGGRLRFRAP